MRNNSILKPSTVKTGTVKTGTVKTILKPGTVNVGTVNVYSGNQGGRMKSWQTIIVVSLGFVFSITFWVMAEQDGIQGTGSYTGTELFQVHFGTHPYELGRKLREGDFSGPTEIVVNSQGNVYVDDFYKHRIAAFNSTGKYLREYPLGNQNVARAFHVNPDGTLWVIFEHEPDGISSYVVFGPDGGPINQGQLGARIRDLEIFRDQQDEGHILIGGRGQTKSAPEYSNSSKHLILDKTTHFLAVESSTKPIAIERNDKTYLSESKGENSQNAAQTTKIKQPDGRTISIKNGFSRVDIHGLLYRHAGLREVEIWTPTGLKTDTVHFSGISYGGKFIQLSGDIYQLDYMPDHPDRLIQGMKNIPTSYDRENLHYSVNTHGVRIIKWQKK